MKTTRFISALGVLAIAIAAILMGAGASGSSPEGKDKPPAKVVHDSRS